ncbi:hypothetical protein KKJFFJLC_00005 [Vibrio phage vB_VpaS_PGB]|nr:hypothetical protein HHKILHMN_00031 [Vibrio phage vB_VpaS_PGA]WVH05548.1 hypothetical protein KKJFFJLC_00005 [Vibrio phage vB_VpaS_PGB]
MTNYSIPGIVMMKVGEEIKSQLMLRFGIAEEDIHVSRSYQPTTQYAGARDDAAKYQIFISPVMVPATIGRGHKDKLENDIFTREFTEVVPAVFQIDFLSDYQPQNIDDLEAIDIAKAARETIMHLDAISNLTAIGIFVEKSSQVRPAFTVTSEAEFESTPNFDLSLTYNSSYIKETPVIESIDGSIHSI